jgi:opacity protein-like surface antigen
MKRRLASFAAAAAMLLTASAITAQQNPPVEFGVDAALSRTKLSFTVAGQSRSSSSTQFEIPVQSIRIAFPLSPLYSLEPAFALDHTDNLTVLAIDLGLLVHLTQDPRTTQWFLRPVVGLQRFSDDDDSENRFSMGIGAGFKAPLMNRISLRIEGRARHLFENDGVSGNVISLLGGISVFTR